MNCAVYNMGTRLHAAAHMQRSEQVLVRDDHLTSSLQIFLYIRKPRLTLQTEIF